MIEQKKQESTNKIDIETHREHDNIFFKDDKIILNSLSKILLPILFIFGLYIHFYGDITPGGGFQSGVIFAMFFTLFSFIKGANDFEVTSLKRAKNDLIGCVGFAMFFLVSFISIFFNGNFLDYSWLAKIFGKNSHFVGIFITEFAIMLLVFSSVNRIINTLFATLKSDNILSDSESI